MKKLKKIVTSFNLLIIGWFSKAFALTTNEVQTDYGVTLKTEKIGRSIYTTSISVLFIIGLFVIGLFIAFNKKISKKAKIITIIIFIAIVVLLRLIVFFINRNYY